MKALLLVLLVLLSAGAEPRRAWTLPEPGKTVEVRVGVTFLDIEKLDAATSTYTVMGYFFYEWKDRRLAFKQLEPDHFHIYRPDEIWTPNLEIVNAVNYHEMVPAELLGHPDGTVLYKTHFVATLTTPLNLRNFPFDRQDLRFIVEPFDHSSDHVKLVWDQAKTRVAPDAFLAEWELSHALEAVPSLSLSDPSAPAFSRLTFDMEMKRHPGYYVWKIVLQMGLLVGLSWLVFYMEPQEVQTGLAVSLTLLLTVIAFGITTDSVLPKVGYRTWLDKFGQLCFFMVFLTALENVLVYHLKVVQGLDRWARRVRVTARFGFPLAFAVGMLALALSL